MEPLDAKERFAVGRQRRKQMRRLDHGTWKAKDRRESPLKLLEESTRGRVPSLVALKTQLMAASPFGYFRGAVPVMAYDLSLVGNTGICNQLCGDAHVRNLGAFAGPDGRLAFDINDFDETIVAPFEWDVKRMATSLILAGRGASVKDARCGEVVSVFLERYRASIASFARMPVLEGASPGKRVAGSGSSADGRAGDAGPYPVGIDRGEEQARRGEKGSCGQEG
jgi:hypothetical protein